MKAPKKYLNKDNSNYSIRGAYPEYLAFLRRKRISKYEKLRREDYEKIAAELFKEIANRLIYGVGGVFLKNFGYFFIWKTPRRDSYKNWKGEDVYHHISGNQKYRVQFVSSGGYNNLRFFSMDGTFTGTLKKKLVANLNAGFKYKTYLYSLSKNLNL